MPSYDRAMGGGGGYDGAGGGAEIIFTDDISMNVFLQHLPSSPCRGDLKWTNNSF